MLIDQLKADMLAARKASDKARLTLLSTVVGELTANATVVNGEKTVTDEAAIATLRKFVKNLEEMVKINPSAQFEIDVLSAYLPQMLSEDEIRSIVQNLINNGAANMGQVMAALKANHAGLYDGKMASTIAKKELLG